MTSLEVSFDQDVYAPGDSVQMTVTVISDDPAPVTKTVHGEVFVDGQPASFTGLFTVDATAPRVTGGRITDGGGYQWTLAATTSNTLVFTTTV